MSELADPSAPLVVGGTAVAPTHSPSSRAAYREIPSNTEAQHLVAKQRVALSELPGVPRTLNATGAVLTYTLVGVSDEDIAAATMLDVKQIKRIRTTDAYKQLESYVIKTIQNNYEASVRGYIAANADAAAKKIVNLMENSYDDRVKLKAATDILDRAGHRPADVVEHKHSIDGGLLIEHVTRDKSADVTIEMGD